MEIEMLIKNYALIVHKASSLSSMQRKLVNSRVQYLVKKGNIKMEQLTTEVNRLSNIIQEQILKEMKNGDSSS
jgi:hypothetical protein